MKFYYVVCLLIIFSRFQNKKSKNKHSVQKDSQLLKNNSQNIQQDNNDDFQSVDQVQQKNLTFIDPLQNSSDQNHLSTQVSKQESQTDNKEKANLEQSNNQTQITSQATTQKQDNTQLQDLQTQPIQGTTNQQVQQNLPKVQENQKDTQQKTKKKKKKQNEDKKSTQKKDQSHQNMKIVPIPKQKDQNKNTQQQTSVETNQQSNDTQNTSTSNAQNNDIEKNETKKDTEKNANIPSEFQSIDGIDENTLVPEDIETIEIDPKSLELGQFLRNLFMDLEESNPFQIMSDEAAQLKDGQSQQIQDQLQSNVIDIQNNAAQNMPIQLDETKHMTMTPIILKIPQDIDDSQYLSINIKGSGGFVLEVFDLENQKIIQEIGTLEIFEFLRDKTVPIDTGLLSMYKQYHFRIRFMTLLMGQGVDIKIQKMNFFELKFSQTVKIVTKYARNIQLKLSYKSDQIEKLSDKTRLQFILKTSMLLDEIKGNEELSMKINQSQDFPTEKNYQMNASGSISGGLIKTLNSKNDKFCITQNCVYTFLIRVKHIEEITFYASNLNNGQEINIRDSLHMIEELEPNEQIKYVFNLQNTGNDYLFTLYPIENVTMLYIQPGIEPKDNQNSHNKGYSYTNLGKGTTKMLITQKEIEFMNVKDDKFYIAFEGKDSTKNSSFIFEFTTLKKGEILKINENQENSGVITKNEIAQYYLDVFTGEPDSFDINLLLKTYEYGVDFYLKECYDQQRDCKFEQRDFNSGNNKNKLIFMKGTKKGEYAREINLRVNCLGNDPFEERNNFSNGFPISVSCKFVMAIINDSEEYLNYQLISKGNVVHQTLKLGISTTLTLNPMEEGNYKFELDHFGKYKTIVFKFVSLVGNCKVYLSTKNKFPDEKQSEQQIDILNENLTSVSTKNFHKILNSDNFQDVKYVYMSIFADTYTVIDVYSDYVPEQIQNVNQLAEKVKEGQIVYRSITEDSFYKTDDGEIYYKDFIYYQVSIKNQNLDFDIQLNSEVMGLQICIQQSYYFDNNKECDHVSSTENLKVKGSDNPQKDGLPYFIRISKKVKNDEIFEKFPIEFNLLIHEQGKHARVQTLQSGQVMSKKLDPNQHVVFKIKFDEGAKNSTILFTSHSFYLQAKITTSVHKQTDPLAILNSHDFAMTIQNQKSFKQKYCHLTCNIFVVIENLGIESSRFHLAFIKDNQPLLLKEGEQIFVPSNKNFYFITKPKNDKPLEITFNNEFSQSVLYGKISQQNTQKTHNRFQQHYKKLHKRISENNFDYKTDIDKKGEIVIDQKEFLNTQNPMVLYLLVPKFNNYKQRKDSTFTLLEEKNKTSVTLHSSIQKLNFNHEVNLQIQEGDFKYFSFTIDDPQNITIIMTSNSGKCTMYVNKGLRNLPNDKNYWKKGQNFQTQEITILVSEFQDHVQHMVDVYTIGIFANTATDVNIILMSNFDNLIKVKNQQIRTYPLKKMQMYFFDFYSNKIEHNVLLFSDQSDVEVSFLRYDEAFGENLLSQLHEETNVDKKFILKANSLPYKETNKSPLNLDAHFIVRARALDSNTKLDLAIYDSKDPLMVKSEERVVMLQDQDQIQIYEANIKYDMQEADIDIKLEFGEVEVQASFNLEFQQKYLLKDSMQQQIILTDDVNKKKSNDIVIFQKIYLRVKANKKSKFSFLMKPHNQFKKIKLMESEIIIPRREQDIFLYLEISHKQKQDIDNLRIDIQNVKHYNQKVELLFNSDQDIQLNSNDPFIPMPIKRKYEEKSKFANHQTIYPQVLQGYYVLKISASPFQIPIKVTVSSNDQKKLEVNGEYYEKSPDSQKSQQYFIYLPEPGEFRIILESCSLLQLDSAMFIPDDTGDQQLIEFPDNLVQDYPYVFDEDDDKAFDQTIKNLQVPVHRGIVDKPGLLKFNIKNTAFSMYNVSLTPLHFYLITEFKPKNKQLIFKDYVDYYPKNKEFFGYEFTEDFSKLKVTAQVPMFKRQLTQDYPDVKKVMIEMHFYLLGDNNLFVQNFNKCGLSVVTRFQPQPKLHTIMKKINISEIRQQQNVTATFLKAEIAQMKEFEKLIIFSHLRISFLENDEDTYDITLNRKFTDVPYFLLKIDNLNQTLTDWSMNKASYYGQKVRNHSKKHSVYYIVGAAIMILCVIFCCLKKKKQKEKMKDEIQQARDQYVKKEDFNAQESNKIEMANM